MITNVLNQVLPSQKSPKLQPQAPSMKNHRFYKTKVNHYILFHETKKKRNAKDWTWYAIDFIKKGDALLHQQRAILRSRQNIQKLELIYFTSVATNSGLNHLCQALKYLVCLREFQRAHIFLLLTKD